MDRAGGRGREADLRTIGPCRQQRRHHHRNGGEQRPAQRDGGERLHARAHPLDDARAGKPVRHHVPGEHIERQQSDLVAPDCHQSRDRTGAEARAPRPAVERAGEQPQHQHQIDQAHDLADVLEARTGCAAKRKGERRHDRAARMPSAIAEEQNDADPAEAQIREDDGIEGAQADRGIEQREQHVQRRKHQRLRIGDLRPAGEHIGRPPGPFAVRDRGRQELQLRKELRFRVPRNRHAAREPGPGRHQEGRSEHRERDGERNLLRMRSGGRRAGPPCAHGSRHEPAGPLGAPTPTLILAARWRRVASQLRIHPDLPSRTAACVWSSGSRLEHSRPLHPKFDDDVTR